MSEKRKRRGKENGKQKGGSKVWKCRESGRTGRKAKMSGKDENMEGRKYTGKERKRGE